MDHARWMHRCLELARHGAGQVAPNPLVGAVLVQGEVVLAEGWHRRFGGPHAEVECLRAFGDGPVPEDAVMVVSLEPCSHHGKTPPCADLLVERGVKRVVIGQRDPFAEVAGRGVELLRAAGVQVTEGVLERECRWTNRRFNTRHEQGRPYVVLKWASTSDGLLDKHPRGERGVQRISGPEAHLLVHRWRAVEQAVLVGSRTVVNDDPALTVRAIEGRDPLRVVLDRDGRTPDTSRVYDGTADTLLFTAAPRPSLAVEQFIVPLVQEPLSAVLGELHRRGIASVLVEGGATLLNAFLSAGPWDEARVFTAPVHFAHGTPAPRMERDAVWSGPVGADRLDLFVNGRSTPDELPEPWHW